MIKRGEGWKNSMGERRIGIKKERRRGWGRRGKEGDEKWEEKRKGKGKKIACQKFSIEWCSHKTFAKKKYSAIKLKTS